MQKRGIASWKQNLEYINILQESCKIEIPGNPVSYIFVYTILDVPESCIYNTGIPERGEKISSLNTREYIIFNVFIEYERKDINYFQ
jgi:hypothetical protein